MTDTTHPLRQVPSPYMKPHTMREQQRPTTKSGCTATNNPTQEPSPQSPTIYATRVIHGILDAQNPTQQNTADGHVQPPTTRYEHPHQSPHEHHPRSLKLWCHTPTAAATNDSSP
ncbi:hypothetical protein BS47DRAFT_1360926 [Hydnum rufescens UP504]|uniref:Uncharacterized protein n=1 Tax=Hydnum rufescens UP504 TaxID=1448309 RepID=A0A9P6B0M4_9AGAM|nr:hypothetical protein BS47DRAFT_1360926 [Hydnum rufescens UP504]